MTYAIISDIHSNLEALSEVLRDIDGLGIKDILCLGDVVGYGPSPIECTDIVIGRCKLTLKGNHDEALVHGAYAFNIRAQKAIDWTRDQLKPGFFSGAAVRRRWEFLTNLPLRHEDGPVLYIHGSPRDPTNEYVLQAEIGLGPTEKFEEIFAAFQQVLFVGHTHLPCVITDDYEAKTSAELENSWKYPGNGKAIVNVGSVGQPRDRDNRACYVTVDGDSVTWHRIPYDHAKTMEKIDKIEALDEALADRLKVGM